MINSSSPSIVTSLPDHLPNKTLSFGFTSNGVTLPSSARVPLPTAVGSGTRADDGKVTPLDVKPKDKVLFGKWSGNEVTIDGEELLIMKESDILGIIG